MWYTFLIASSVSRIHASDDTNPTTIEAVIPCLVVRRQKSSITIAGRFADAATLNAHPTRNDGFISLHSIPSRIAAIPTPTDAILPTRTLAWSSRFIRKRLWTRSWAIAPDAAMIKPDTVPSTVVNAIAEMHA